MIVYKYFQWNRFSKKLFTDQELYLGASEDYNDPLEFAARFNHDGEKILKTIKRMNNWRQQAHMSILKQSHDPIATLWHSYVSQVKSTGICCFSQNYDNILMWSHYADNHRGICVAFDTELLQDEDVHLYKVKYRKQLPVIDLPWSRAKQIRQQTTKYIGWKYEQEIRAIKQFDRKKVRKKDRKWYIDKAAIKEIFLGCRCSLKQSEEIRQIYITNNFTVPVSLMKVSQEMECYKLIPQRL